MHDVLWNLLDSQIFLDLSLRLFSPFLETKSVVDFVWATSQNNFLDYFSFLLFFRKQVFLFKHVAAIEKQQDFLRVKHFGRIDKKDRERENSDW